jgi:hypothetical protein
MRQSASSMTANRYGGSNTKLRTIPPRRAAILKARVDERL